MATTVTYVGLDVHGETILAQWGKAGEKACRLEIPHTPAGLDRLVKRVGTTEVRAGYEASGGGFTLYDRLVERGWTLTVVPPTHLEQSVMSRKRKTDGRDADRLQRAVMAHGELGTELPAVWVPDAQTRADRETERRRLQLGEDTSGVKAQIRSLLARQGTRCPDDILTPWGGKYRAWLQGLAGETSAWDRSIRVGLASLLRQLEFVEKETERLQDELERLAQTERYQAPVERLTRNKGVGVLTAMVFLLELGDPHRFRNRRQVGAYLGLTPTSFESGASDDRKGHITKMGPGRIRKVLNQAAWTFLRFNPAWQKWYGEVAYRRGKKRAIVATMRKLGIKLWHDALAA